MYTKVRLSSYQMELFICYHSDTSSRRTCVKTKPRIHCSHQCFWSAIPRPLALTDQHGAECTVFSDTRQTLVTADSLNTIALARTLPEDTLANGVTLPIAMVEYRMPSTRIECKSQLVLIQYRPPRLKWTKTLSRYRCFQVSTYVHHHRARPLHLFTLDNS